jgi:SAM-dependent methyltransferase
VIEALTDPAQFRERSREAWGRNHEYWLTEPLRHVKDVGTYITNRIEALCCKSTSPIPVLVDMGCGNAWLLKSLRKRNVNVSYVGLDNNPAFIQFASERYRDSNAEFVLANVDSRVELPFKADFVVNAFNFFELCDLNQAMCNVSDWLRPNGTLFMSTIDKTYLILALSKGWNDFHENLKRYQELQGIKYGFQKIDLGTAVSDSLEYPSVLYSTEDFVRKARENNLFFVDYVEQAFTSRTVPKIYCHFEFHATGNTR